MFQMLTARELFLLARKLDRASFHMTRMSDEMRNELWEVYREVVREFSGRP